jgi:hypothetical protein
MGFTRWQWLYSKTQHTNTQSTQHTKLHYKMKDTLHTVTTTQKKSKAMPVTGRGGL